MKIDTSLLLQVIDRSPEYIFWKDRDGLYQGSNDNFLKLLGFKTRDQLIGKHDSVLPWGGTTGHHYIEEDDYIFNTGGSILQKKVPLRSGEDGKALWLYVSKVPLYDDDGSIGGILGVFIDITLQEKTEEKLVEQRDLAESANIAKSEFLANMSHDMRTPLTGILGLITLALKEMTNPALKESIELMQLSGSRLLDLLNGCIEAAHVDAADVVIQIRPFTVQGIVNNVFQLFAAAIKHKNIAFNIEYHSSLEPYVDVSWLAAEMAISRVLQNLVSNAIKFTDVGGITITVKLGDKSTEARPLLVFEVKDTGIGIPKDQLKAMFEKFTKLNTSRDNMYAGSGLGLYVVQKYLDVVGGQIFVASKEGEGSVFTVIFPVKESFLSANEINPDAHYA